MEKKRKDVRQDMRNYLEKQEPTQGNVKRYVEFMKSELHDEDEVLLSRGKYPYGLSNHFVTSAGAAILTSGLLSWLKFPDSVGLQAGLLMFVATSVGLSIPSKMARETRKYLIEKDEPAKLERQEKAKRQMEKDAQDLKDHDLALKQKSMKD